MSKIYFVRETAYRAKLFATNNFYQWNYLAGGFFFFLIFIFSKTGYLAKDHFYYGVFFKNPVYRFWFLKCLQYTRARNPNLLF